MPQPRGGTKPITVVSADLEGQVTWRERGLEKA
jgi:hypothetical protein